jgi:tetratricopeptide (TPR) repeat protein
MTASKRPPVTSSTSTGAILFLAVAVLFAGNSGVLAQQVEEQAVEQSGPPPELLLSNANNLWITAEDKKTNQAGDPTRDYQESIHYFFLYMSTLEELSRELSFDDSVRVYSKLASAYRGIAEVGTVDYVKAAWDTSLSYYQWLIDRNPEREYLAGNYLWAGYATWQVNGLTPAIPYYEKYVELEPDDLPQREFLIRTFMSTGDLAKATDHALVYMEKNPANADIVGFLVQLRSRLSMRWLEITNRLVELQPDTPIFLLDMARHYYEQVDYATTIDYAQRYLAMRADDIGGWKLLGDANKQLGHHRAALAAFDEILKLDPRDVRAHADKATVYLNMGNIDSSWRSARTALRYDGDFGQANAIMGDAAYRWLMQKLEQEHPGRELDKLPWNYKYFIEKTICGEFYEAARKDPLWREYAVGQINYLMQYFPQPQDNFMSPPEEKVPIVFPPPGS